MKRSIYIFIGLLIILASSCSTRKDKFANRNFQALNTKYNVLYNGNLALQDGLEEMRASHQDNFWDVLSVERMLIQNNPDPKKAGEGVRTPNFDRAEDKAIKAIQKRSMYIGGKERNYQIDEAYLLLGKARYYELRFVPAAEAFNFILLRYPDSDRIYEAKVWKEKTNIRLGNEDLAIQNLNKILGEIKFKNEVYSHAHASIAQAYVNLGDFPNALKSMYEALEFSKPQEERARFKFIIGQIYEKLGENDSAYSYYQKVIDMKRKSPRMYTMHAHARQLDQFDTKVGDSALVLDKFKKLIEDRENRPFLDVLYHQLGLFYEKYKLDDKAIAMYNQSLRKKSADQYRIASNYRNIAEIYFYGAQYKKAGIYYDSTLTKLVERTREHRLISKKRRNLEDVIKYEAIANANDSILMLVRKNPEEQIAYFEDFISKLKMEEEKRAKMMANASSGSREDFGSDFGQPTNLSRDQQMIQSKANSVAASFGSDDFDDAPPPPGGNAQSNFYFYNQNTVMGGKRDFEKRWGRRQLKDNWRFSDMPKQITFNNDDDIAFTEDDDDEDEKNAKGKKSKEDDPRFNPQFYISQLPSTSKEIDSIKKERNFAYYQLGLIYKEKFKEYILAINKLENLLESQPEERLVLPSLYNLHQLYKLTNNPKASEPFDRIINEYPDSRYAQILTNKDLKSFLTENDPNVVYARLYKLYDQGTEDLTTLLELVNSSILNFTGEEIVPKMELLKASILGKLQGLEAYVDALNFVALTYPNAAEGKDAEELLQTQVPKLEALSFGSQKVSGWKMIFPFDEVNSKKTQSLVARLQLFVDSGLSNRLRLSFDPYKADEQLLVLHGLKDLDQIEEFTTILREYKDYLIQEKFTVISNEDYKIVQIKKNFHEFAPKSLKP